MLKTLFSSVLVIFLLLSRSLAAEPDGEWHLIKERAGIKIFHREVPDSPMVALKGVMRDKSTLAQWVALLDDVTGHPRWMHNVASARILEQISPTERVIYTVNDTPAPARDRDLVVHAIWSQNEETGAVTLTMTADPDYLPPVQGLVRIPRLDAYWKLTPVAPGELEVEYYLHAEPGGAEPDWIVNLVAKDHPYYTLKEGRNRAHEEPYKSAHPDFIRPGQLTAAATLLGEHGQ